MCDYPAGSWPLLQDNSIGQEGHLRESYGDIPPLKQEHTLRVGFQNVGGVSTTRGKAKDDFI
jgi:hypothetical protein